MWEPKESIILGGRAQAFSGKYKALTIPRDDGVRATTFREVRREINGNKAKWSEAKFLKT